MTRIYNNIDELKKDVVNNVLKVDDNIEINFDLYYPSLDINALNIKANNIDALNINAKNINAWNIDALNIKAWDINTEDINARNITALNIKANNINALNIKANNIDANNIISKNIDVWDINALNIDANNIIYYAVCFADKNIRCNSIKGIRKNSKHFCLDGEITIKPKEYIITLDGKTIKLSEESYNAFKEQFNK